MCICTYYYSVTDSVGAGGKAHHENSGGWMCMRACVCARVHACAYANVMKIVVGGCACVYVCERARVCEHIL